MSPLISTHFLQRQSDDRLVAAARAGNERAFEVLVRRHQQQMLAYARRLTGTDARAEDALQQALLHAWVALRGDAHPERFKPWLFRIVHNVAVTGLRRSQHADVGLDEALETAERTDPVDARMAFREALTGLAALPEPQRRAIVLTAFGSSHDEAAAELGLSGGAVRGLIYRARATLRSAAGLLPAPLASWLLHRPRRSTMGEHTTELLAGSSSVGGGGLIVKAGAIAATAGALAAGTQIIPGPSASHHHAARRVVRIAERHVAATRSAQPGARTATVLLSSTSTGGRAVTKAVAHSPVTGRDRPQARGDRSPTGDSRPSGERRSDGGGSGGGSRESSGGGGTSGSGGGDSSHGSGDGSSSTSTTQSGHDSSGSDGGGGATAASTGSTDGSSATGGSGSTTTTTDGHDGGGTSGGSDGGSSTPTGSSDVGGGTTTTATPTGN